MDSILEGTGISFELYTPIWRNDAGVLIQDDLHDFSTQFSKDEAVNGGYLSASFTAVIHHSLLDLWLGRIGYDFQVFSDSQQLIWQGFINEITINYGVYSLTIGPLMNMSNRSLVQYQTISYNTNPPIGGNQAATSIANNTESQEKYGILETNISGGQGTAVDMAQLRDTYIDENKQPATSQKLNLSGSNATISIAVKLLGYYSLLGKFYFSQSGTGTQTADTKLKAILAAHPSITFDDSLIEANSLAEPVFSDGSKFGVDEARNIVVKGDSSDRRYQFGIYGRQTAVYKPIPTSIDSIYYYHVLSEDAQQIELANGAVIAPWDIEAGRWLTMLDFVVNTQGSFTDLREDPRAVFIESVQYTAPSQVTITGGTMSTLAQKLAKLGLGGM